MNLPNQKDEIHSLDAEVDLGNNGGSFEDGQS